MTPDRAPSHPAGPVLQVRDLSVELLVDGARVRAATDVSYDVHAGEVVAVVGASGAGKSQSSLALVGLQPPNARVTGSVRLAGRELVGLSSAELDEVRGTQVSMVFQEPTTALNPVYTAGFQVAEGLWSRPDLGPAQVRARVHELLTVVGLPDPVRTADAYPHQLSGGQRQRVLLARALACDPTLLVADEPTSALDVTVQAEILDLLRDLRDRTGTGIVLVTHDIGVVADLADRVVVMSDGRVVETGAVAQVLRRPRAEETRVLLAAVPQVGDRPLRRRADVQAGEVEPGTGVPQPGPGAVPVLAAVGLVVEHPARGRVPARRAVEAVDLTVGSGEVVGLVGESGSGKTTFARAAAGLVAVSEGSLRVAGEELAGISARRLRAVRRHVAFVFQDPGASLDPRLPVGRSIEEPLRVQRVARGPELARRVEVLLDQVHLPARVRDRYPHELSGGQRQRVAIARALALRPQLLVADEPTSALDVSAQSRVLDLLEELQRASGFACLLISHDLAVVDRMASRVAVMDEGRVVEQGTREQVLHAPRHPRTRQLLDAAPVRDPGEQRTRREGRRRAAEFS